jgi:hypothetical protein
VPSCGVAAHRGPAPTTATTPGRRCPSGAALSPDTHPGDSSHDPDDEHRPTRKTLASQLDRLDGILDRLGENLNEAVASAVREAVGLAVQEAVQAVLTELLTNPALREQLRRPAAAESAPPDGPANKQGGDKSRLAALCGRVGDKLRSPCRAGAGWLRRAAQAASLAWRLADDRLRAALLVVAAYLARTALAAAARRLGGASRSLAGRAWGALRRALPAIGLRGT